ncbi:MAG: LssY C-terminal domain-containing protein [Chloroflexota bacterium]
MKVPGAAVLLALCVVGTANAASTTPQPPWKGLPTRTSAHAHSTPGDPVNIGLEGTREQLLSAFSKIGWRKADPLSPRDDLRLAKAAVRHGSYPSAPVSNLFLFGRAEDFAVEHELGWVGKRDHARFWDTGKQDASTHRELWIGDCSQDIAIKIIRKHGVPRGTTHVIDGHLDVERNLIVSLMQRAGLVQTVLSEPGIGHVSNLRNATGDQLYTDGKATVIVLK